MTTPIPFTETTRALDALPAAERRARLAAWLSDANAVPGAPALRRIADGAVAAVDDLMAALRRLDGAEGEPPADGQTRTGASRIFGHRRPRRPGAPLRVILKRHRRDDDDDPPPCPATAALPARAAEAAAAA